MSVYDKELIIDGKAVRSPEQQVYKNMKDIESLQDTIKPEYKCTVELSTSATSVAKSNTNAGTNVKSGWLLDTKGKKFKITGGDDDNLLIDFYTSYQGPQGESGADDIDDNSSGNDDKVYSQKYIGNIINNGLWYSETQPSGSPLVINITSIVMNLRDNPNCQNTIQQGDMFFYVDGDGKAKELYKIDNITSGIATVEKVCDIGGGKTYIHCIYLDQYGLKLTLKIQNKSNTQFTLTSLKQFLQTNNFVYNVNPYECFGTYKPASTEYAFNMLGMNSNDMYVYNITTGLSIADSGGTFVDTVLEI